MDFAEELRGSLQEFLLGATIEIRENGSRITASSPLSWEVRGAGGKPLLHLWAENCNVTRRVLAIADQSEAHMAPGGRAIRARQARTYGDRPC
jgi:hypothetical protein